MKRVLFIAYLFPPIANSGTQRPMKFAKYLPQFGWEPLVLTADRIGDHRIDERLVEDIPDQVRVTRVPMLNDRIGQVAGAFGLGLVDRTTIADGISWRLRDRYRVPDLYALWRPTARRAAMRLYREVGFDAVYATGFPWTSLLTGMDVARVTGCPLVVDFRDPWAAEDLFNDGSADHSRDVALERDVIKTAAAVVSVSATLTSRLIAAHAAEDPAKFVTIPNGYDPEDLERVAPWPRQRFRIVYTGVWKPGYGLDELYDAIERVQHSQPSLLSNVEVLAAGFEPGPAHRRPGLSEHVTELGIVSHADAVALMRSADVLFLPNASGSRQQLALPGKIFEYLGTGRPVLAVTDPTGEAGRLITRIGGGVVVTPGDIETLTRTLVEAFATGVLTTPPQDRSALQAFERRSLTRSLASLFDQLTPQRAIA